MLRALIAMLYKWRWIALYWGAFCLIWGLYGIQALLLYLKGNQDTYPLATILVAILLTIVALAYRWAIQKMLAFECDIQLLLSSPDEDRRNGENKGWYTSEFEQIFAWKKSVLSAALFTLLAIIIAVKIRVASWLPTESTRISGMSLYVLIGTAFGACVWPGYRMFVFVHRLAGKIKRINPFAPTSSGIFKISRTFVKFEAVGAFLILLFGAAFGASPYQLNNRLILILAVAVSIIWTFWFFFTQGQIHKAMVRYKHEKQEWFAEHYEKVLSKLVRQPDKETFEELQRYIVLKKEIDSIPVWPFDARALLTSLGVIISPILAVLAQRLLGK
jgi:hypothetical protein